jgi:hypothetical protein
METKRDKSYTMWGWGLFTVCLTTSAIHGYLRITSAISANLSRA